MREKLFTTTGGAAGAVLGAIDTGLLWANLFETMILAFTGAVVGYLTNKLMKFIFAKIRRNEKA